MKTGTLARSTLAIAGMAIAGLCITGAAAGAQGFGGGPGAGSGFGSHRSPLQRTFAPDGGRRSWWNNPRTVERLKLTDEQRKAMDGIMLQYREKLIDLHANLEKAELAMQPLMSADTPDDAAITAQIDKIIQARGDLERANSLFLLAIRDKLTPDQWKQVQAFRDSRDMRGGQGPGMPGPGGRFRGPMPPPPSPDQQSAPATPQGSPEQK